MKKRLSGLLVLLALALCGCTEKDTPQSWDQSAETPSTATVFAMDTVMDLTVYGGDEELLGQAEERILELEGLFSVTSETSELHTLNQEGAAVLSEDTAQLLRRGLDLCGRTGGALDLSIYPLVRAWGFTTGAYRIPEEQERAALLERVDYTQIRVQDSEASIPSGMEVDLGSVAKGYTGDALEELLRAGGVTSALLNLGGNVQALGSKPDGSPWRIGIQDPEGESYLGVLELNDQAAITSGSYERFFVGEDGNTYWHIIDPATGAPAVSGLTSVTIVGDSGLTCDALSTALFVMGLDRAVEFWRQSEDFETILITEDGGIYVTEGLEGSFSLAEGEGSREMTVVRR